LALATGGTWLATHTHSPARSICRAAARRRGASGDLEALAGKVPLIKRTWRPPNYETPLSYFSEEFTPNKAFFVRYHLASIPEIAADKWTLKVGGDAATTPFELNLEQLKRDFSAVEVAAVNQCSGNRRGLFDPHVGGVEWGAGAMGNARWQRAPQDVLQAEEGSARGRVDGADGPVMPGTPDTGNRFPYGKR
jgi:DMSO/TMAO reductase YedYZ molybdopterin-dependent catalytic subunit